MSSLPGGVRKGQIVAVSKKNASSVKPHHQGLPVAAKAQPVEKGGSKTTKKAPTTGTIKNLLRKLGTSQMQKQAISAIMEIDQLLLLHSKNNSINNTDGGSARQILATTTQTIMEQGGLQTMAHTMERYQQTELVVEYTIRVFQQMTHVDTKCASVIIDLDVIDLLVSIAATRFVNSYEIQSGLVGLLCNLSIGNHNTTQLSTDECIEFVSQVVITFTDDTYVVKAACQYFLEMSEVATRRECLLRNGVSTLLAGVYEMYNSINGNSNNSQGKLDSNAMNTGHKKDNDNKENDGDVAKIVAFSNTALLNILRGPKQDFTLPSLQPLYVNFGAANVSSANRDTNLLEPFPWFCPRK